MIHVLGFVHEGNEVNLFKVTKIFDHHKRISAKKTLLLNTLL